jgi:hypothetical protein
MNNPAKKPAVRRVTEKIERAVRFADKARDTTATTGDDAFRMLQILTRVKGALQF